MLIAQAQEFQNGYTPIAEQGGAYANMLMDFGILKISAHTHYSTKEEHKEVAYLLLDGSVECSCNNITQTVTRNSLLDDPPFVLHVSAGLEVHIQAHRNAELVVQKTHNTNAFEPKLYTPDTIRNQRFGEGAMQDTSTRIVRTVFDAENAPYSNMVLGEVINFPGKWSTPHVHPKPEIFHYRFSTAAKQGFGFGEVGDKAYKIRHQSSLMIEPWVTHPQCAAPGYPMYYVWMIPHLPNNKFGPNSRQFKEEHIWLLDDNATIWEQN